MSQDPAESPPAELSPSASRWLALAEQLSVCVRMLRGVIAPLAARHQLSQSQLCLVLVCRKAPPCGLGQRQLAESLAASPAQVSAQVEQLRRMGLLAGRRGDSDRRRQFWRLTPAGRTMVRRVLEDLADWAAGMDGRLDADRFAALARLLDKLGDGLRDGLPGAALRRFDPGPGSGGEALCRSTTGPTAEASQENARRAAS